MDEDRGDEPEDETTQRDVVAEADAMADELEDELADDVASPSQTLPKTLLLPGLTATAAIALPLHPSGYSFAQLLYVAWLRSPLEALITLVGFGSPFLFGMIVALVAGLGDRLHEELARRLLVTNLSFLHAQLLLVAWLLFSNGQGMMPWALLGFSLVSGGFFIVSHARATASGGRITEEGHRTPAGPSLRWLVRWGSTVIVAICGWIRLQMLVDVRLGWAIEVLLASCIAMTVLVLRRPSAD